MNSEASFGGTAEPLTACDTAGQTCVFAASMLTDIEANATARRGSDWSTRPRRPPAKRDGWPAQTVGGAVCAERLANAQRWRLSLHGTSEGQGVERRDGRWLDDHLIDATPLAPHGSPLVADMPNV